MSRGTMHAPKPEGQRRRRNATVGDSVSLPRDGALRGPELGDATGIDADSWAPQVRAWWATWRESPQAAAFEATDWQRLAMLAPLVAQYIRRPSGAVMQEIRMNEERLGATVVDRIRARMTIEPREEDGDAAPVLSLADHRAALADRLGGDPD